MEILQIGREDWTLHQKEESQVKWHHATSETIEELLQQLKEEKIAALPVQDDVQVVDIPIYFSAIILSDDITEAALKPLVDTIEAYAVFLDEGVSIIDQEEYGFVRLKRPQTIRLKGTVEEKMDHIALVTFPGQYGAKLKLPDIDPSPLFKGDISYLGHVYVQFQGDFGQEFTPLFSYRYNLSSFGIAIELWQEFIKEGDCAIQMELIPIWRGSSSLMESIIISEEELKDLYIIQPMVEAGMYSISFSAKGSGTLRFGPMHWRYSRIGYGDLVLGGKRSYDDKRQEFFSYFNPGDLKPPLNVYFSGYRGAEGFEGFGMMKSLKAPFVLIADPRLEGGAFYAGTEKFESQLEQRLQEALDYLGFDSSQIILSGLSMGAFGALYYASKFNPYGVVVGKPFTNLGDTAMGMKLRRPYGFETSGDILLNMTGNADLEHVEELNQHFWDKFSQSDFENTQFAIAYMEQDDYDNTAKDKLIEYLSNHKYTHIFTKGYEGRHNDNSRAINNWFMRRYIQFLEEKFGRKF